MNYDNENWLEVERQVWVIPMYNMWISSKALYEDRTPVGIDPQTIFMDIYTQVRVQIRDMIGRQIIDELRGLR